MNSPLSPQSVATPARAKEPSRLAASKGRLLVADDELGPRESVRVVFADAYEVHTVASGREAVAFIKQNSVDVVVLDIRMPDLGGIDVLRQIKQADPQTEVVMLTAYETLDTARDAIRFGATDYLNKPFDVRVLRDTVARCMENRRRKQSSVSELASLQQRTELLQREILNTNRALTAGVLAAGIVHDVNNPLSIIMIKTELMLDKIKRTDTFDTAAVEEIKSGLELVNRETERCRAIARRFLDLSRRRDDHVESISVKALLTDVVSLMKAHGEAHDKELVCNVEDDTLTVGANPAELLQVLVNLGVNSLQAMKTAGKLEFSARRHIWAARELTGPDLIPAVQFRSPKFDPNRSFAEIAVSDNGNGIPPEVLPRILEPYFTTKPRGQGTGLGLAICVQLVDHYNGALKISSQVGKGTTCSVYLPLSS